MRTNSRKTVALCVGVLLAGAGCGLDIDDLDGLGGDGTGPTCYDDSECVPNACCGEGNGAVHYTLAPDCSAIRCSAESCPAYTVNGGTGLPVCRNSKCTVATTVGSDTCG
jgi:hypothetical protein